MRMGQIPKVLKSRKLSSNRGGTALNLRLIGHLFRRNGPCRREVRIDN